MIYKQLYEEFIERNPAQPNEAVMKLIREYQAKLIPTDSISVDPDKDIQVKTDFLLALYTLLQDEGFYTKDIENMPQIENPAFYMQAQVKAMCRAANTWVQVLNSGLWITTRYEFDYANKRKMNSYMKVLGVENVQ